MHWTIKGSMIWSPTSGCRLLIIFPLNIECGRHWRIKSSYLDSTSKDYYIWLRYSAYFDGVFCQPCVAFRDRVGKSSFKKLYTEPFTRWNGAAAR